MSRLAEPHGGVLVDRLVEEDGAEALRERAAGLPALTLSPRELADLELVASGAASPLTGFMGLRDYRSVLERLRLADGTPWPVPFTLAVTIPELATALRHGAAALRDPGGTLRAVIDVSDAFVRDPREEARALHDGDPRGVAAARLARRPTGTLGGRVHVLPRPRGAAAESLTPRGVRALASREGWTGARAVATRDGSGCLEPVGGSRPVLLPVPRVAMGRGAGRDAILQALVLKNFGARDVYLEHDRADWIAASPDLAPEDLGIAAIWVVAPPAAPPVDVPGTVRLAPGSKEVPYRLVHRVPDGTVAVARLARKSP